MAIAFDTAVIDQGTTGTSHSWSHTCTGSNRLLLVGVMFQTGTDANGTPTYNGVSMTQAGTGVAVGGTFNEFRLYYLVAPATGANTITVNNTGGGLSYAASMSYTGVAQSSPIDVTATNTGSGTSIANSFTTTVDNDWLVEYYGYANGGFSTNSTAGSGTTVRTNSDWSQIFDSNGAKTPTGTYALNVNKDAILSGVNGVAIKPFVAVVANGNFFNFM